MNEDIKKRLMEKVETVVERVEFIEEHLSEEILRDRILRKAIYKEFQEAVEAASDVCAMLRRGLNSSAKDDYSNIDFRMDRKMKEQLLEVLRDVMPYVKGVLVYGSFIKGYADVKSDIDICVIEKEGIESKDLYGKILGVSANERYDIVVFNKIPWYLRGEILENNEVIYAEDEDYLDFWLYKQSKIWNGMKRRQKSVSAEDLIGRVKEEGLKVSRKSKGLS
ncbi:MAG: nucleotidyltransferase domain-containing protein [Methanophagales archaeon]|nr:nucleotidyltransferase domain-containing protein [Methanophagales archaeon]